MYAAYELNEPLRGKMLRECLEQIDAWGLTMPTETVYVRDFGVGDFRKVGEIEFWIVNRMEEGYCGKFIFLFDGQECPSHHHRIKHETFFVLRGRVEMVVNGIETILREGQTKQLRPGEAHSFAGIGPSLVLEISTPSIKGDSYFSDLPIPPAQGNHVERDQG